MANVENEPAERPPAAVEGVVAEAVAVASGAAAKLVQDGPGVGGGGDKPPPADQPGCVSGAMGCGWIFGLAVYFLLLYGGLVYLEYGLWHQVSDPNGKLTAEPMTIVLPWILTVTVSANSWLLILVLATGALGSFVHAATSFADYVGNQQARRSWIVWFVMRPLIGSALALVVYLVLRSGLISGLYGAEAKIETINTYGFAAVAALAGMFSKQATDKLSEVFDALFRTKTGMGDDARKDKIDAAPLKLQSLKPTSVTVETTARTVSVTGTGFSRAGTVAKVDGKDRHTTVASDTSLSLELTADDVAKAGILQVAVAATGAEPSNSLPLTVTA
jgi:hypothetical protein